MANIDSKYDSFNHFTIKFNSKDCSISFCSGIFNSKDYSIAYFPEKFNSKNDSKVLIWLDSIQLNIHSIRKPGYRTPLGGRRLHAGSPSRSYPVVEGGAAVFSASSKSPRGTY